MNTADVGIAIAESLEGSDIEQFLWDSPEPTIGSRMLASVEHVDASDPNNLIVTCDAQGRLHAFRVSIVALP